MCYCFYLCTGKCFCNCKPCRAISGAKPEDVRYIKNGSFKDLTKLGTNTRTVYKWPGSAMKTVGKSHRRVMVSGHHQLF